MLVIVGGYDGAIKSVFGQWKHIETDEMNVSKWDAEVAACSVPFKDFMNAADLQTKYRTYVI